MPQKMSRSPPGAKSIYFIVPLIIQHRRGPPLFQTRRDPIKSLQDYKLSGAKAALKRASNFALARFGLVTVW